jgi:hypothetical protein
MSCGAGSVELPGPTKTFKLRSLCGGGNQLTVHTPSKHALGGKLPQKCAPTSAPDCGQITAAPRRPPSPPGTCIPTSHALGRRRPPTVYSSISAKL